MPVGELIRTRLLFAGAVRVYLVSFLFCLVNAPFNVNVYGIRQTVVFQTTDLQLVSLF